MAVRVNHKGLSYGAAIRLYLGMVSPPQKSTRTEPRRGRRSCKIAQSMWRLRHQQSTVCPEIRNMLVRASLVSPKHEVRSGSLRMPGWIGRSARGLCKVQSNMTYHFTVANRQSRACQRSVRDCCLSFRRRQRLNLQPTANCHTAYGPVRPMKQPSSRHASTSRT